MLSKMKWALALSLLAAFSALAADSPAVQAATVSRVIQVDGRLDEAQWRQAPIFASFVPLNLSGKVRRRTEVRMLYTPQGVAFGFRCLMPQSEIRAEPGPLDHMNSYRGESVEVMLDSAATAENYIHLLLNAADCPYDGRREQGGFIEDGKWNSGFLHAVSRDQDGWTAELLVPYRALDFATGVHPTTWKVNFARHSLIGDTDQDYSVAAPSGNIHTSGDFLPVNAPAMDLDEYKLAFGKAAFAGRPAAQGFASVITCDITNLGTAPRRLKLAARLYLPDGKVAITTQEKSIPAGARQDFTFAMPLLSKSAQAVAEIQVRSAETNRILLATRFPCKIEYIPLVIDLIDPHYKNAIFATQKLDKVRFLVKADASSGAASLLAGVRRADSKQVLASAKAPVAAERRFEFDAAPLPETALDLFVQLLGKDGKPIAEATERIRKLPYVKGEVFIGKDDLIYRDGKPVFILAGWTDDYTSPDYNVSVVRDTPAEMIYLDVTGMPNYSAIYRELKATQTVRPELQQQLREFARKHRADPRAFAYFMMDEPHYCITTECAKAYTAPIREEDPWHPAAFCCPPSYHESAELFGTHPYPDCLIGKPFSNFQMFVARMEENYRKFYRKPGQYADLFTHQGFNYGDCGRRNNRIPSYEEFRTQNLLMLILGCQGVLFYNRTTPQYPELYVGMHHLRLELMAVGKNLVIQERVQPAPASAAPSLKMMGRRHRETGKVWLMACNASDTPCDAEIVFPALGDASLQVLSESRRVRAASGRLKDHFAPWEVHVYTDDATDFHFLDRAKIHELIEAEYRKRVKPGNLAYQRFENETVEVTASSNFFYNERADNVLFHLADGVCDGPPNLTHSFNDGVYVFKDNTPNKVPDWFQFKFKRPVRAARVVLYPVANSVVDYTIEVMQDGAFVKVAEAKDVSGARTEVAFPPVTTDTVRCTVTKNRGPNTLVYEMEVYAK